MNGGVTRYADPFVCPDCSARLPLDVETCPGCGLHLRGPIASQLLATLQTADRLLEQLRAEPTTPRAAEPAAPSPAPAAPPRPRPARHGLSHLSVPKILLGLGALCLLVAAVIFLAVAWSWLGVGGRTAVLVGLTLLSGGLGVWLGGRELRMAAEALTTVALGLLALDVVGADNAGWLGDLSANGLLCVTGSVVTAAALALAATTRLGAPQLAAAFAGSAVGLGALGLTDSRQLVAASVVLGYAVLVAVGRLLSMILLVVGAATIAFWWWLGLAVSGLEEATDHASFAGLWAHGHGLALLTATLMLLLPVAFARHRVQVVHVLAAATATGLTVTATLPAVDESATTVGLVAVTATVAWTVASQLVPETWRAVSRVPLLACAVPVATLTLGLAAQATLNAVASRPAFSAGPGFLLPDPDPVARPALLVVGVAALLGAAASLLPRPTALPWLVGATAGVALGGIGSLALLAVPGWTVAGALAALGAALTGGAVRRAGRPAAGAASVGVVVVVMAAAVAVPSDLVTTIVAGVLLAQGIAIRWAGRFPDAGTGGGLLVPVAAAGFLWSGLAAVSVDAPYRGVPVLLVVGLLALALPTPAIELAAALAGAIAAAAAVTAADDTATALAIHLTVAGALVTASALIRPTRRVLGWPGAGLLAAATWVRLADLGVEAPEPYTLPSAVGLVVVGLDRLRRDPEASTATALVPGLLLGTVPSLLWALDEPASLRALLLGIACLGLALAGPALRWSAPLLVGSTVGAVLVLRELAPYAADVPQWVLIGLAGTALTVVGTTWERRVRDVRRTTAYLGRLR